MFILADVLLARAQRRPNLIAIEGPANLELSVYDSARIQRRGPTAHKRCWA